MKIAVLADLHANLPALHAVIDDLESWRPDRVVVAGDVVNRGPRPHECLRLIQDKQHAAGWYCLRGNHEDYVIENAQPDSPRSGPAFEVHRASFWTCQQLDGYISHLQALPYVLCLTEPNGGEVRFTHASMGGTRDGIYPGMSENKLRRKIGTPPAMFCVGHTHLPLIRRLDGTLVVNVGSVGLPFDGDHRPSYARLTWNKGQWDAEIVRISYDRAQAERDFYETGYLEDAGPLAHLVLVEFQNARSQLYQWAVRYQERALAGEISMLESVEQYLARHVQV